VDSAKAYPFRHQVDLGWQWLIDTLLARGRHRIPERQVRKRRRQLRCVTECSYVCNSHGSVGRGLTNNAWALYGYSLTHSGISGCLSSILCDIPESNIDTDFLTIVELLKGSAMSSGSTTMCIRTTSPMFRSLNRTSRIVSLGGMLMVDEGNGRGGVDRWDAV
jgi:hypothetical protein